MLTEFLIRDETISSLGKAKQLLTVHDLGKTTSLCDLIAQAAELVFHPETSVPFLK